MQLQQILALMTEINEKYNLILANAKTIDELEEQLDLLANSFVAVRVGGVTQKLQVQKIIDAVQTFAVNEMVSVGTITVDGNDVTIPAGAQWRINGVNIFSSEPTVINIPLAATGKIRTDIIVANSNGSIYKVTGTETDTGEIAVRPAIPFNSVLVTQINVTDASFDTIVETIGEAPIDGNMYGRKDGAWEQIIGGPGTTPSLPQVLAQGDQAISDDGLKKIQIDKASSSVKIYTRPTTGDAWVLKTEYTYGGVNVTDETDTNTVLASGVGITDGMIETTLNKSGLLVNDYISGEQTAVNSLEYFLYNGTDETRYQRDKIQVNGTDYPLPTGASSPFATLADIPTINENYKGTYTSLTALQTAHPTAAPGNYAMVDTGSGSSSNLYIWDAQDGWVLSSNASPSTTDALVEGSMNLYFTFARVLATALTGLSTSDGSDVTSANSILVAIGKLQKQLTDVRAAKEDKRSYMSQSSPRFLDNTTALQKIFNVGSSGNGSIPVTAGRKYRVVGWAVFSGLTSISKTISFGILGTATASYVSGIAQSVISVAIASFQVKELTSFSATQISSASATTAAKMYIDFEFNCNGSGTFIPSILFSSAQANMQVDSAYFQIVDIGASTENATSNIV